MLFNSFSFLAFFALLVIVYYAIPHRFRWGLLLLASLVNYAAFRAVYVLLLLGITLVGYLAGMAIEQTADRARRKALVVSSIVVVLGALFVNKYYGFFAESLNGLLGGSGGTAVLPRLTLAAAAGLSFYTFSCVSYLVDVYQARLAAERHFGRFALYISFFPKLLAGPLERARPFLSRLDVPVQFDSARVTAGLQLVLWGLFKKVVIADRLAPIVDAAYRQPSFAPPADLVIATYFFAFQLYCDFSGYSDIAIGTAKVLGFDLMENFRRPYLATTVREFWANRWHLSLSAWFRDYLYIPLGGSRVSASRLYVNLLVVFLVSGLWHGANWTFVVWGGLNGLYQVVGLMIAGRGRRAADDRARSTAGSLVGGIATFHLVLVTWVFFRAATLSDAVTVLSRVSGAAVALPRLLVNRLNSPELLVSVGLVVLLLAIEWLDERRPMWSRLESRPVYVRWTAYYALLLSLLVLGNWNLTQFVYMQF
jgi:D-alanyl-lipoteichoic acid acyltransferase DltB (MBOAT superfamily)